MQTVFEVESLKPFSDTQSLTLLTHRFLALSTLFNVLPHTHKVVHEQAAIRALQDSFNDVVNIDTEQG